MNLLIPEHVDTIVIHITDSNYGDVETIDRWHKDLGWDMIGYHFLVTNCYPTYESWIAGTPDLSLDGAVFEGRPEEYSGAHVKGHNWHTLGVAMVGRGGVTSRQLDSTIMLCAELRDRFPIEEVKGHNEFTSSKTCPDLDMDLFRSWV